MHDMGLPRKLFPTRVGARSHADEMTKGDHMAKEDLLVALAQIEADEKTASEHLRSELERHGLELVERMLAATNDTPDSPGHVFRAHKEVALAWLAEERRRRNSESTRFIASVVACATAAIIALSGVILFLVR